MRSAQRELYREGLKYFELNDLTKSILKPIIAGDDKATDFEDCVKTDPTISRQIILDANLQLMVRYNRSLTRSSSSEKIVFEILFFRIAF